MPEASVPSYPGKNGLRIDFIRKFLSVAYLKLPLCSRLKTSLPAQLTRVRMYKPHWQKIEWQLTVRVFLERAYSEHLNSQNIARFSVLLKFTPTAACLPTAVCLFLSTNCCRRVETFAPVLRAFLLSAHRADDLVAGIQAIKHCIETFFIKLQASLILFYNQLFWKRYVQAYPQLSVTNSMQHCSIHIAAGCSELFFLWIGFLCLRKLLLLACFSLWLILYLISSVWL